MTVTLLEIVISVFVVFAAGMIIGYFLSKNIINKNAVTADGFDAVKRESISLKTQVGEKTLQMEKMEKELAAERESVKKLSGLAASREEQIVNLTKLMAERKNEFEELNKKFNEEFRKIANQILINNSGEINRQTAERLKDVLSPFREQIDRFEKKIDDSRSKQINESATLKEQINQLTKLNLTMSEQAKNLTTALKGDSKTRGNWGEMILERILEGSGLLKGEHYTVQASLKGEESGRLQPDVIIHLPENRHLIIDSKVSLVDYEKYINAEDGAAREALLKNHINSIYRHVDNLSSKEYQKAFGVNPPDFVFMFIPIEAAVLAALESDRDLFVYAWEKNIAIIYPTTLIPTLKIINNIWRQESQNKNALAIAETGGKLYDKFVGFLADLQQVGKCIDSAKGNYDDALKKLSTGRGNILGMTQKMKDMGAKVSKNLPAEIAYEEEE